jgi:hypothetical protein
MKKMKKLNPEDKKRVITLLEEFGIDAGLGGKFIYRDIINLNRDNILKIITVITEISFNSIIVNMLAGVEDMLQYRAGALSNKEILKKLKSFIEKTKTFKNTINDITTEDLILIINKDDSLWRELFNWFFDTKKGSKYDFIFLLLEYIYSDKGLERIADFDKVESINIPYAENGYKEELDSLINLDISDDEEPVTVTE